MSNVIQFRPATREQVFFKGCIHGVGGSGKTLTGLLLLAGLVGPTGRIAVIDTERGRANKYLGRFKSPLLPNGIQFDSFRPTSYDPASLTEAVAAAQAAGYDGLLIDSGSHYWDGPDGMQEQVDKHTGSGGSSFNSGWKVMTPIEQRMWATVTGSQLHVVMTLRVKSDYVMEDKQRGERVVAQPRKVGLKPRQRDGFEYEFDVVMSMDETHTATVTKSDLDLVCPVGAEYEKPGPELGQVLLDFCRQGEEAPGPLAFRAEALDPAITLEGTKELLGRVDEAGLLTTSVLDENDQVVTLRELIYARARAIKAADDAAHRAAAAAAAAPPRGAVQGATAAASQAPKPKHVRLREAVDTLLGAADVDEAGKAQARAVASPLRTEDVSGLLVDDQIREELSIGKGQRVTLEELAAAVCTYVGGNKRAIRPAAAQAVPAQRVHPDGTTQAELDDHIRDAREIAREAVA